MFWRLEIETKARAGWVRGAMFRYGLISRVLGCARRQGIVLIAWGFSGETLRLVVASSEDERVSHLLRGIGVGTYHAARRWGVPLGRGSHRRCRLTRDAVEDAVVWVHSGPVHAGASGPLASPWSSHRDLLGFRSMGFDAAPLRSHVDPMRLHARCGGRPLPTGRPSPGGREDLWMLLRLSAAVVGVLSADHRCFRLFVHLARARGWTTRLVAQSLDLTPRRVRQLAAVPEPRLDIALKCLADPRLCAVP